jgi:hypothetical protein
MCVRLQAMEQTLRMGRCPAGRPGKAGAGDRSAVLALPAEVGPAQGGGGGGGAGGGGGD